jgi:uncharacterized membrane protein YdbT with pleckstrin-like domain
VAFPSNLLNTGEEIVLDLRPHWLFMFKPVGTFVGALIVGIGLATLINPDGAVNDLFNYLALALGLGTLVWVGWRYLNWTRTMFVLTTDRIITRTGVINKSGIDVPLDRVNTVFFSQKWYERLAGAGDLAIESAGERGTSHFTDIRKPGIVQKEIYVQIESNENRKFDRMRGPGGPGAAPEAAPAASIPEQIEQLSQLHQRGVLSDAEFARKKAELLDRM